MESATSISKFLQEYGVLLQKIGVFMHCIQVNLKVVPLHAVKEHRGSQSDLHSFFTSAFDGNK
jgi:hypothetical protein